MISGAQIAAILVGAFYIVAGIVVLRAMALDRVMDRLLAAMNDPAAPNEALKSRVLTVGAYLTMASGVALALLSPLAVVLFALNAVWQCGYLLWAERALPPADEDEARGRQQTKNAFVVYLAASAFVVWLAARGYLRAWSGSVSSHAIDLLAITAAGVAAWAFIRAQRKK